MQILARKYNLKYEQQNKKNGINSEDMSVQNLIPENNTKSDMIYPKSECNRISDIFSGQTDICDNQQVTSNAYCNMTHITDQNSGARQGGSSLTCLRTQEP
jgi:hypothetical protein